MADGIVCAQGSDTLLFSAITGVLRNAEDGMLPAFAGRLALSGDESGALNLELAYRGYQPHTGMQTTSDASATPSADFTAMADFLHSYCVSSATGEASLRSRWLVHALAAACLGRRHLWQDLGLRDRDEVSALIAQYFPELFLKNILNLKWKHFLFSELGKTKGIANLQPPDCSLCGHRAMCFPMG